MAHRVPFAAADADALIGFCVASGSAFDPAILRRLLLDLTSDPAGVPVVADGRGPVLAATVIDRGENGADAASLEVLGVGAAIPGPTFAELVVAPAIAFTRAGVRRALHVPLHPACARIVGAARALASAGFSWDHDVFTMRRRAAVPAPEAPAPLPSGWQRARRSGARWSTGTRSRGWSRSPRSTLGTTCAPSRGAPPTAARASARGW